jgi:hypothetical protein
MRRLMLTIAAAALAALATAPSTAAAGGVLTKGVLGLGANSYDGVTSADGEHRYTALYSADGAMVLAIDAEDGTIESVRYMSQDLIVPAVAEDGSPAGLSADGSTLVLAERAFRFPQERTRFHVFDTTRRLKTEPAVSLPGTWTFDALSPDGRILYLINYTSPNDLSKYRVRAYDLARGELRSEAIVDPREAPGAMYGTALTRVNGTDGRWAYTLYDSAERHHPPFVHALNTETGTAMCIDLDPLAHPHGLGGLDLQPSVDGTSLAVVDGETALAAIDLETFEVSEPAEVSEAAADEGASSDALDEGGFAWPAILVALGVVAAGGSVFRLTRRHRSADATHGGGTN